MKGTLVPGTLPQLLRGLYTGRRTGLLHVSHGDERRSIRFRKGHIVRAETNVAAERLGETLVRQGELSAEDLARATEVVVRDKKKLGAVLQELGIMTRERLDDALALHVREMLLSLFRWTEGRYLFEALESEAPVEGDISPRLPTGEMILEAVAAIDDPEIIRRELGELDRILSPSLDPMLRFQKITLTPADGFLLSRVDGTLNAREVLELAPMDPAEAERGLFGLVCAGVVEWGESVERKVLPELRAPPAPAAAPEAPSRPATPTPEPLRPAPPTPRPEPAAAVPPVAPVQAAPAPEPPGAEEARRERRREVEELHGRLKTLNHFEVLDIPRGSNEQQVKAGYFAAARRYHPDTHTDQAVTDLEDKIEAIFIRISEAYEVLRSRDRRASYEAGLPRQRVAQAAPAAAQEAATPAADAADPLQIAAMVSGAFKTAAQLYQSQKYFDAIKMIEPHLETAQGPMRHRLRLLLARCYAMNPKWVKQAEETILEVLQLDPRNVEAHLELARLYKEKGLRSRASSMLRKVLELDPSNETALAALGPSPEPSAKPDSGGLLKRIFGKG